MSYLSHTLSIIYASHLQPSEMSDDTLSTEIYKTAEPREVALLQNKELMSLQQILESISDLDSRAALKKLKEISDNPLLRKLDEDHYLWRLWRKTYNKSFREWSWSQDQARIERQKSLPWYKKLLK
mgnify:CR=1 FL=1